MLLRNDAVMDSLKQGLDVAALRQRTIAHNIANLNTPRFKRSYVSFEENLRKAQEQDKRLEISATHARHFKTPAPGPPAAPAVKVDESTTRRIDGNNVDMEKEMLGMVTNQLRYNALARQTSDRLNMWEYVVHQGRR